MAVYIETGSGSDSEVSLISSFKRATRLFGGDTGQVKVFIRPGTEAYGYAGSVKLPFSYDEFRTLFENAAASGKILDMKPESWADRRRDLAAANTPSLYVD